MKMAAGAWLGFAALLAALCTAAPARAQQSTRTPVSGGGLTALRKAAAQGDTKAEFNLGLHFYRGQGVRQDYAQ
ncbi:MAG: hypothetical protein ACRD2F_12085, partial [Terriglobales bacterium]